MSNVIHGSDLRLPFRSIWKVLFGTKVIWLRTRQRYNKFKHLFASLSSPVIVSDFTNNKPSSTYASRLLVINSVSLLEDMVVNNETIPMIRWVKSIIAVLLPTLNRDSWSLTNSLIFAKYLVSRYTNTK